MPRPARPWFRFYVEAVASDRKIRRLDIKHRWLWVAVLAIGRQSPKPGVLLLGDNDPFDVADIADFAAMAERDVRAGLAALERAGLIVRDDAGVWSIPKWNERQFEGDFSRQSIPDELRAEVFARDNGECQECGATEGLQIDHIVPVTAGGPTELHNLQLLCGRCNRRKGNRVRQQRYRERHASRNDARYARYENAPASRNASVQRTDTDTEIENPPVGPPSESPSATSQRGTRIPEPFTVTAEMREWVERECAGLDWRRETEQFCDYWRAATGQKATKRDWPATWRTWMRRAAAAHTHQPRPVGNEPPRLPDYEPREVPDALPRNELAERARTLRVVRR